DAGRVSWRMPCQVLGVDKGPGHFSIATDGEPIEAAQVVMATGGMAIPQLGATDFALGVARQFGLKVVEPRPALVPLTFDAQQWQPFSALAGVALEVGVQVRDDAIPAGKSGPQSRKAGGTMRFTEDLLFTHRGLSGPAILQISSFWNPGRELTLDLAP